MVKVHEGACVYNGGCGFHQFLESTKDNLECALKNNRHLPLTLNIKGLKQQTLALRWPTGLLNSGKTCATNICSRSDL